MKYYPYLRAKQFELKALRELAEEYSEEVRGQLIPIIEPVNQEDRALSVAIDLFLQKETKFALVVNPTNGDFKHRTVQFTIPMEDKLNASRVKWIPAYIVNSNVESVKALMLKQAYEHVMLLFPNGIDEAIEGMKELLNLPMVQYVVSNFAKTSRYMKNHLLDSGKEIICLDDNFNERAKNADYAETVDELFTENVFYYEEDKYSGYSDYTTLPSNLPIGGMLPYAIAIHMTYKRTEKQIYIHHFVSDTNDTNKDTDKKFAEAGLKVIDFYDKVIDQTPSAKELIRRAMVANAHKSGKDVEGGYPGLGYLKKLSIKNHIELLLNLR